jgi:hypothetical protein
MDLLVNPPIRFLEGVDMGNAKFFYYPQPDGRHLVEIDLGEPLGELQSEFEHDAVDAVTQSGAIFRSVSRGGEIITIQRDRMQLGEDLAIQFDAMQNHLDRGYSVFFCADADKAWAAAVTIPPQAGIFALSVNDAVFSTITGTSVIPVADDYVVIESDNPPYIRETQEIQSISVTAGSGGTVTLKKRLNFDYTNRPVFMRHYRTWPVLKRPQADVGKAIITNEGGRLFSLSLRLVVDYQTLFAYHNGMGFGLQLIPSSPATGDLENQDGRVSLDQGMDMPNPQSGEVKKTVHSKRYGSTSFTLGK